MLVTRPAPHHERTEKTLRERGYDVEMAPVLWTEQLPVTLDVSDDIGGVVVTSANTLHLLAGHPHIQNLLTFPLFAVGDHTARVASAMGFKDVHSAAGGVDSLIALIVQRMRGSSKALLYLAAEDVSRDLEEALWPDGIVVRTETIYRMIAAPDLPQAAALALKERRIEAVLHYSRRSAQAFVELVTTAGLREAALAVPQCCLSPAVADILREAGAAIVIASSTPREQSLLAALDAALGPKPSEGRR